jgi:hypothetical protein
MFKSHLHKLVLVVIAGLSLSPMAKAQGNQGWQFDSLGAQETAVKSDAQIVYELLLHMLDRWNAHDMEGYVGCYWRSPELLVIVDSEQFNGWQELHDSYLRGYPDPSSMGFAAPARIQVKFLRPDLALALTWWSLTFPNSKQKVVGNTTLNIQKFEDGWKIVACHTSTAEM